MKIGVLKETVCDNRVIFLPEHVIKLKKYKIDVLVEKGAGINAMAFDKDYMAAGASVKEKVEVMKEAGIIARVNSFTDEEIKELGEGKVVLGILNDLVDKDIAGKLNNKKLTSFSLEIIPRTTRAQAMDVLSSMATIAGYKAVFAASVD